MEISRQIARRGATVILAARDQVSGRRAVETLAKATSYFLLLVFTLVNLSLWRLKRSSGHPAGIIRIPYWVPVAGFQASLAFVVIQAVIDIRA